jgi:hypothetical protein
MYELEKWFAEVIDKESVAFCGDKKNLSESPEVGVLLDKLLFDTVKGFTD